MPAPTAPPPLSPFSPPDLDRRVDSPALSGRGSRQSRMRPVSRRHSRRGLVGGSTFRRTPISRSPLDKTPKPGHLSELQPVNAVNTKGQFFRASFGKKPQVPNTARQAASLPGDISRGKRSSMPQPKTRPDSPVPSLQGPCDRSLNQRNPEVPASTGDEALFQCTKPSGVPRGPSHLQFP